MFENVDLLKPEEIRKTKKMCQRKNSKDKEAMKNLMKSHTNYLENKNWLSDENRRSDMPENSSYSMMHSFDEGFNIVMYSGTHNAIYRRKTTNRN